MLQRLRIEKFALRVNWIQFCEKGAGERILEGYEERSVENLPENHRHAKRIFAGIASVISSSLRLEKYNRINAMNFDSMTK